MNDKKYMGLKIGILGTRGIPNQYGGFEQVAEYLSAGLMQRGHEVMVYNSHKHPYQQKQWNGVPIIHCFDPEYLLGTTGQFIYDLNCILDARKRNFDIVLMLGYTSSSVWKRLYPSKSIIISNMDGLEWNRAKYSRPVRRFLKYAEKLAVSSSHYHIADSEVIKEYLDYKYKIDCKYIAYGADLHFKVDEKLLREFNLVKKDYFVSMARLEPENNVEMLLDGFSHCGSNKKFIVIGNTSNRYGKHLVNKFRHDDRIIFIGALFDQQKIKTIIKLSNVYFHGHSVGGTNPSLLEAMAAEAFIAAHSNPFNKSILRENAVYFTNVKEVTDILMKYEFIANEIFIQNNYATIRNEFTWDKIIGQYDVYFRECYLAKSEPKFIPQPHIIEQLVEVE
ncbi:MAG: DUF1972 domain-containing protein [Ferruginibacter sp.]